MPNPSGVDIPANFKSFNDTLYIDNYQGHEKDQLSLLKRPDLVNE
jgi:predicted aldo/keto reductase-like oxidoreductase